MFALLHNTFLGCFASVPQIVCQAPLLSLGPPALDNSMAGGYPPTWPRLLMILTIYT